MPEEVTDSRALYRRRVTFDYIWLGNVGLVEKRYLEKISVLKLVETASHLSKMPLLPGPNQNLMHL